MSIATQAGQSRLLLSEPQRLNKTRRKAQLNAFQSRRRGGKKGVIDGLNKTLWGNLNGCRIPPCVSEHIRAAPELCRNSERRNYSWLAVLAVSHNCLEWKQADHTVLYCSETLTSCFTDFYKICSICFFVFFFRRAVTATVD